MKIQNIKKFICLLLALLLIIPSTSACKKNDKESSATKEHSTEGKKYDVNGGGRDFIVLTREADTYMFAYNEVLVPADAQNDRVSAAVFNRNEHVNDLLNINIVASVLSRNAIKSEVEKDCMAGTQMYDLVMSMVEDTFSLAINGYLTEWGRIPHVDETKEYWMTDFFNATSIGGYHFFCPGAANISAYNTVGVTFFNKEIRDRLKLTDPYELVRQDKWTFEQMKLMCAAVTADTDGYPGMSYRDTYGLAVNAFVWQPFFYASGYMMVEKDNNDIPYLSATQDGMSETVINLLTQITSMVNNPTLAILTNREEYTNAEYSASNLETDIFVNDRALFWVENVYGQVNLREMKSDYGILPMPKWSEEGEYVSYTHAGHASVMSLTKTTADIALSGAVMEEMASYSDMVLIPEFYEQTIRIRGSRDGESLEMLDVIYGHIVIDLGIIMKSSGLGIDTAIRNMLKFNDTGYSSMFAGQGKGYRELLSRLSATFANNAAEQYS